ncbi:hypothetical protein [Lyngbya confervoides]|uniref:DUF1579 domain-containing protein n=1 Tax=Lyngbya confervoides BDU141951 TaxID=1574623 RepID=A0ABD4T9X4_9CYAN|nr:hypothetical protein [Lyngbya confervoides]MCM1985274.1 hypothetical protein [Lyngbya confervoides BDU141951]
MEIGQRAIARLCRPIPPLLVLVACSGFVGTGGVPSAARAVPDPAQEAADPSDRLRDLEDWVGDWQCQVERADGSSYSFHLSPGWEAQADSADSQRVWQGTVVNLAQKSQAKHQILMTHPRADRFTAMESAWYPAPDRWIVLSTQRGQGLRPGSSLSRPGG